MKLTLLAAALLGTLGAAHAADLGSENLSITGFGTLAAAKSNTEDARYTRSNQREGTAGTTTIGLDSNLGLQATYKFSDKLSATTQILSRKSTGDSFTTELAWAFVKYQVNDDIAVRVGRVVMPTFLISDYQNVGYANTMMRPPTELYGSNFLENIDGADISWQHSVGETTFTVQAVGGVVRGKAYTAQDKSVERFQSPHAAIAFTAERGPVQLRVAHVRGKLTIDAKDLNKLSDAVAHAGFEQFASDFSMREKKVISFTSVGLMADWNNMVVQSEYGIRRGVDKMFLADADAWYLMAGYRFGTVLPYYSHGSFKSKPSVSIPAGLAGIPPLYGAMSSILAPTGQKSDTLGVRWDFAKSAALKVQVDRIKPGVKNALLSDVTPAGVGKKVTVLAAGVDFVF
ncbi:porin [Pseudoduganella sp. SL102]|uniref:porin n=1 Tax=Pseudoduganella sp. SL102 TaxID=2995154 RepID=UPI00248B62CF|nr:porin [Pseudoduganella sp. SL102]WBS05580.1 porin [Pseudoduganella sp. SL102]